MTDSQYGTIFLGKDEKTYGKEGTGWVDFDPDFECGGKEGTPGRQCAFETTDEHTMGLGLTGVEGRNLHVNIASFRDPLCPRTLYNMFTKATRPHNIYVRVLQQNDPEVDIPCLRGYCERMAEDNGIDIGNEEEVMKNCPYADQIFIHHIHAQEAAGPTWARGLLSKDMEEAYHRDEIKTQDFCMSTDSHMDFEPEWDVKMAVMWDDTKNEYAVLSTYVQDIEHLGEDGNGKPIHQVPHLCMVTFTSNVRTYGTKCANNLIRPKLTTVWGAGLSFSKCHAELKVQVDPYTPHIFDGEEFNRAARFWTYGYDIYTPNHVYVLHDYHKSQSNPVTRTWGMNRKQHGNFQDSNKRLRTMLDMPDGESDSEKALRMKKSKFGLGDRRTLDQLIQFTGIDLRNEKASIDGKNRCGNLQWVPFKEHSKGVNYIPKFDNKTEDPLDVPYEATSVWYNDEVDGKGYVKIYSSSAGQEGGTASKSNTEKGDDGLPENIDLDKMHADLLDTIEDVNNGENEEQLVEGGRPADHDLGKMHAELFDSIKNDLENMHQTLADKVDTFLGNTKVLSFGKASDIEIPENAENYYDLQSNNSLPERRAEETGNTKLGVLRGVGKKVKEGAKVVKGYVADHPLIPPAQVHGLNQLPLFVKCNVFIMVFGVIFAIFSSKGTGRAFRRNERKQRE